MSLYNMPQTLYRNLLSGGQILTSHISGIFCLLYCVPCLPQSGSRDDRLYVICFRLCYLDKYQCIDHRTSGNDLFHASSQLDEVNGYEQVHYCQYFLGQNLLCLRRFEPPKNFEISSSYFKYCASVFRSRN